MHNVLLFKMSDCGHHLFGKFHEYLKWWRPKVSVEALQIGWSILHKDPSLILYFVMLDVRYYIRVAYFP